MSFWKFIGGLIIFDWLFGSHNHDSCSSCDSGRLYRPYDEPDGSFRSCDDDCSDKRDYLDLTGYYDSMDDYDPTDYNSTGCDLWEDDY